MKEKYKWYNVVFEKNYNFYKNYINKNIDKVKWVKIDHERKEIDLTNIENPTNKWYKMDNVAVTTFFYRFYNSNPKFFGPELSINKIVDVYTQKVRDMLKIFFEAEYEWYDILLKKNYAYYKKYIKKNIEEIKWLKRDKKTKNINLTNIEYPNRELYKIDNERADIFFHWLYKSNPELFAEIDWTSWNNISIEIIKEILKIFFENEYSWYKVILDNKYESYKNYILWNINGIKGVKIDKEKKEVDLSNIEDPQKEWYTILSVKADIFLHWLYKLNPTLFAPINWINESWDINISKAQEILKLFFSEEW